MNKRKLKRAKGIIKKKSHLGLKNEMIMNKKAEQIIQSVIDRDPQIDCIGNFIFFSTQSGEAWMLDHRDNRALRLAEDFKALPYKIIETRDRFSIEWTERFRIQDGAFIASQKDTQITFNDYPTKTIEGLIETLKKG